MENFLVTEEEKQLILSRRTYETFDWSDLRGQCLSGNLKVFYLPNFMGYISKRFCLNAEENLALNNNFEVIKREHNGTQEIYSTHVSEFIFPAGYLDLKRKWKLLKWQETFDNAEDILKFKRLIVSENPSCFEYQLVSMIIGYVIRSEFKDYVSPDGKIFFSMKKLI